MIASAIGERHILPRQTNATSTILIPPNYVVISPFYSDFKQ
ncbi:conserved hypothetical protein [Staphylococcus aureus]|nr:hypothetical protein USA300HOU_1876 [Staphylococcus aureus subsp. aureus USA300_TCH1516]EFT85307.1 hypothetical protein CGSSa03_08625 [Staphylococcus aureus subsp. aureus CGS03]EFU23804.1 hypothetical protein CGSSa00_04736 [Staphylococcus aureus subsp. aureus CGS00]EFU26402.1 hypothetical protein CGSSa01_12017 [Staphylococcus aureus subsp. aureus CGS01]CRI14000.1 conserved hypothetical protein [Staphylococcus aureus]